MVRSNRIVTIYPSVGGEGGNYFEDPGEVVSAGPISRIEVRAGEFIDAIRVTYGRGSGARTGAWHGGGGGNVGSWDVPEDSSLIIVMGRHGDYVDQLLFRTSEGVDSPRFGGRGGNYFFIGGEDVSRRGEFDDEVIARNPLVEIMGCCGEFVDRLYFRFQNRDFVVAQNVSRPWQPRV
jgi:hypothetical protein